MSDEPNDIVTRLRLYANADIDGEWASVFRADLNMAADEIERLRKERDEARQEVCQWAEHNLNEDAKDIARDRGWDCFKEKP